MAVTVKASACQRRTEVGLALPLVVQPPDVAGVADVGEAGSRNDQIMAASTPPKARASGHRWRRRGVGVGETWGMGALLSLADMGSQQT